VEPREVNIDSNMHMEFIPFQEFAKVLETVFKKADEKRPNVGFIVPHGVERCHLRDEFCAQRVSSEGCGDSYIFHHCRFKLEFRPGQVLRIQMHARPDRGTITPYVQLFHVCENFNLCLPHLEDPVDIFAKYVTKSIRNRTFSSVHEYQTTWLPIVAMETATSSVGSEETIIVDNVSVKLFKTSMGTLGKFELDSKFCDFRQIEIGGRSVDRLDKMNSNESAFEKCSYHGSLDYLCIRHTPLNYDHYSMFCPASVWVGHALVKKVKQLKSSNPSKRSRKKAVDPYGGSVVVTFKLRPNSIPPPAHLFERTFTATVEIIVKSEVDR